MVQLLWCCILGTQEYSIYGLQSHWESHLLTDPFQKPLVQNYLSLLAAFPRAPTSPLSQSGLLGMYCTHRSTKKFVLLPRRDGRQDQQAVDRKKTAHILLGLFFCSGSIPGENNRWKQAELQLFPFSRVSKLMHTILYMCRRSDSTTRKGFCIWSFPDRVTGSSARKAGYHYQPKRQSSCGNSAVKVFMNVKARLFPRP